MFITDPAYTMMQHNSAKALVIRKSRQHLTSALLIVHILTVIGKRLSLGWKWWFAAETRLDLEFARMRRH
jgi:hypothetical protein